MSRHCVPAACSPPINTPHNCDNLPTEFELSRCVNVAFTVTCPDTSTVSATAAIWLQKSVIPVDTGLPTNLEGIGMIGVEGTDRDLYPTLFAAADCLAGYTVYALSLRLEWSYYCSTNTITFTLVLTTQAALLGAVSRFVVAEDTTTDDLWPTRDPIEITCVECDGVATLEFTETCPEEPGPCEPYLCYPLCVANVCPEDPETVNTSLVFITANDGATDYEDEATWVDGEYTFTLMLGVLCGTLSGRIYCDGEDVKVDFDLFDGAVHTYATFTVDWTCVDGDVSWTTPTAVSGITCALDITLWTNNVS